MAESLAGGATGSCPLWRHGHRPSSGAPHLGRFRFFGAGALDKKAIRSDFDFLPGATVLQDTPDRLVLSASTPSGPVKVSFFGGLGIGRLNDPLLTGDGTLLVASLEDLLATKLKATLDRAEAKDYMDIASMISAGTSLPIGLSAFKQMFHGEPAAVLRAIGFFGDGDLRNVGEADREILRVARDRVGALPAVRLRPGLVPADG